MSKSPTPSLMLVVPMYNCRLWEDCADDLTFNYYLILRTAKSSASFSFVPISWREEDQVTNVKLFAHGRKMLRILSDFSFRKRRFMQAPHNTFAGERTYRILHP
jgi:dolichol-phosphate mannosyltransferase